VQERGHRFVRDPDGRVFRENEIWRRSVDRTTGRTLSEERITVNRALVTYDVPASRFSHP
jgi:vancomycin resistance protein VanW